MILSTAASMSASSSTSSSIGMISGGALTMRSSPSTSRVSFERARMRSLARTFSRLRRKVATSFSPAGASPPPALAPARQPLAALEAELAPGDGEARGEPHHVPLPGPRQGLVEVVDVEDELAVGGGEGTGGGGGGTTPRVPAAA